MWGLWLVVSNTEAQQHQQQPVGWPAANPKVVQKLSSFNEKSTVNIQLSSSSQQANFCSVQFHHKVQLAVHCWDHVLEGSAHTPSRDTRHGKMTRTSSSRCGPRDQTSLTVKGMIEFLPRSQSTYRQEVKLTMPGKTWHCTVNNLLCQGHMTLTGCLEHQTLS